MQIPSPSTTFDPILKPNNLKNQPSEAKNPIWKSKSPVLKSESPVLKSSAESPPQVPTAPYIQDVEPPAQATRGGSPHR